ncbi:MAG TPA: (Fe-S)-binding protein [bacterium]|nr:(Fe-S)-binding protein [bacterium]
MEEMNTPNSKTEKKRGAALLEPYDADACEVCGKCLSECPVMGLSESAAKREMTALRRGSPGAHVLYKCETCFSCNLTCPNGANPLSLFLERFNEEHVRRGLPAWSSFFQPHDPDNFRTNAVAHLSAEEKKLLEKWSDLSPCEEFAYPGCNICSIPVLTQASFLRDLNIRGGMEYCCGEMYFRTGMHDQLRATAARLNRYFEKLGAKKMMVLCTAGYSIFTNVLPKFGLKTDMEITAYLPWLWGKIESGEIKITKPLGMKVTIQESCHAKVIGPEYEELPRKILEKLGAEVVEMPHNRDCAYCCGIGGGFPAKKNYHPLAVTSAALRAYSEAAKTGADAVLAYCAGCVLAFSAATSVIPGAKPVYHIFELVQLASGETPQRKKLAHGRALLLGALKNQAPKLLSTKRISPPDIPVEP